VCQSPGDCSAPSRYHRSPGEIRHVTESILKAAGGGDSGARDRLFDLVYGELRTIARHRLSRQRKDHTVQATDLVLEAWLRLLGPRKDAAAWPSRPAFFQAAATAMQRILIDHARKKGAARRSGVR